MLIELLVVLAIVGILIAIAIPSYLDWQVRVKVAEGLGYAGPYKNAIIEQATLTGRLPTAPTDPADTDFFVTNGSGVVRRIRWSKARAALEIWFGSDAGAELFNNIVWLKPTARANGSLTWTCMNHTDAQYAVDPRYLPSTCR